MDSIDRVPSTFANFVSSLCGLCVNRVFYHKGLQVEDTKGTK